MSQLLRLKRRRAANEAGFTIVELLVYLVIGVVLIGSIYQLLIGQNRMYMKQRELTDVRSSLRATAALLTWEFRQAGFADLSSVGSDSFSVRSFQGTGVVCVQHSSQPRLGLWGMSGEFSASSEDSVLIYWPANKSWLVGSIVNVWDPVGGGLPNCEWSGSPPADTEVVLEVVLGSGSVPNSLSGDMSIEAQGTVAQGATVTLIVGHPSLSCGEFDSRARISIDVGTWSTSDQPMSGCTFSVTLDPGSDKLHITINIESDLYGQLTDDLFVDAEWLCDASGCGAGGGSPSVLDVSQVGSLVRSFRSVQYGIYQDGGRWWLGRQVGSAASYEKLTGPLRQPSDSGLVFVYYDAGGNTTTIPAMVAMVKIIVRGESFGKVRKGPGDVSVQQDTLTTWVSLRG